LILISSLGFITKMAHNLPLGLITILVRNSLLDFIAVTVHISSMDFALNIVHNHIMDFNLNLVHIYIMGFISTTVHNSDLDLSELLPLKSGRFLYHGISIETTRSGSSSSSWSDDFSYIYFFFRRRMVFFIFSGIDPICSGINFGFPVVVSLKIPLHIDIRLNTSFSIDAFVLFSLNISM